MDERIVLRKADNGFVVENYFVDTDGEKEVLDMSRELIEHENIEDADKAALKRLLEIIAAWTGKEHDNYAKDNLVITFDGKGRKVEED